MDDAKIERALTRLEDKIDALIDSLNDARVEYAALHAKMDGDIHGIESGLENLRRRVAEHEAMHWKFTMGTTGIVGAVMAAAKWISSR